MKNTRIAKIYITMDELERYLENKFSGEYAGYSAIFRDVEKNYNDFSVEFLFGVVKEDVVCGSEIDVPTRIKLNLDELNEEEV